MAFCKNCGSEIDDNAQFCGKCGAANNVQTQNYQQSAQSNDTVWGILGIVFAFVWTILGLIFSIVAMNKYPQGSQGYRLGKIGLWISIVFLIISVVFIILYIALGWNTISNFQ